MDANLRLPSLSELDIAVAAPALHSPDRRWNVTDPPLSGAMAQTSPAHREPLGSAPVSNVSWTAINHRQEPSEPTPPPTASANLQPPDSFFSSPSHRQENSETTSNSSGILPIEREHGQVPLMNRASPPEQQTAGKPITADRQGSAVFSSVTAPAAASNSPRPSSRSGSNSELFHRVALRDAIDHPVTPPPDSSLAQTHPSRVSTHPTTHDTQRDLSQSMGQSKEENTTVKRRQRSRSDVTGSPMPPCASRSAPFANTRHSMPPPPVPTCAAVSPSVPGVTDQSSSPKATGFSQSTRKHSPEVITSEKEYTKNPAPEQCAYCHDIWTFPSIDIKMLDLEPAQTASDMHRNTKALYDYVNDHKAKKDANYREWAQRHRVETGITRPPCMQAPTEDESVVSAQAGSKRKSDIAEDEGRMPSKLRKLSCDSPPRRAQLTPPPEQPINPNSTTQDPIAPPPFTATCSPYQVVPPQLFWQAEGGSRVQLTPEVARLLQIDGAPASRYEPPANDSSNMWFDRAEEGKKTSKREETQREQSLESRGDRPAEEIRYQGFAAKKE